MATQTHGERRLKKNSPLSAWLLDGKGGGRELEWKSLSNYKLANNQWLWIHLDY